MALSVGFNVSFEISGGVTVNADQNGVSVSDGNVTLMFGHGNRLYSIMDESVLELLLDNIVLRVVFDTALF